jgi:hypothetical protein
VSSRRSRETAYGDLVAGLLDVRRDPATQRFDAELAAAEDDGRIDAQTARVLRWWQRESLRSVVEHARLVVPPTLLALEQAAEGAGADVETAAASLARVAGDEAPGAAGTAGRPGAAVPTDLEERRRRMLVAGLTRVRREQ